MTRFPWAIIAPQKCIHCLEGVGEFFYTQSGGSICLKSEPESFPNPTYDPAWIQSMWQRYELLGYQLLTGDVMPYYSLFDEKNQRLFIYQKVFLEMGYTPLSFKETQDLISDQVIFFA